MWVPPEEKDPVVLHAPTRKSLALVGAVRPSDGFMVTRQAAVFNAQTFLDFLKVMIRHQRRGRKLVLVLDNARYHHARLLRNWLRSHNDTLVLLFLPPYSPDLNPIERVWKLTRRLCTHNQYFPDLQDLGRAVTAQLARWAQPNDCLRRLCAVI
jgi:transposase